MNHDELFKQLLSTFFIEFLELFLPHVADSIDRNSVTFLPQEYFADLSVGEKQVIDLLAEVRLAGEDAGFLIHVENQASTEANFTRRIFFYFARLHQKYLQHIYPIVVFSFDEPYREESHRYTVGFDDLKVLEFNFFPIQLNRLNWRDYLTQQNPVAAALMAKMRIAPGDRPKVKAECLRLLATLRLDPARTELISGFVDSYLRLNAQEEQVFQAEIGRLEGREQEVVMQIVTSWMEQGIEQGIEQGLQREKFLILRLLGRRVGELPGAARLQIDKLSITQLEDLGEALLDFSELADLEIWLQHFGTVQ
jgi:predicted transposase/invertase (TIGR01784 family)